MRDDQNTKYHLQQLNSKLHVAKDELRYQTKQLANLKEYIEDLEASISNVTEQLKG